MPTPLSLITVSSPPAYKHPPDRIKLQRLAPAYGGPHYPPWSVCEPPRDKDYY